MLISWGRNFHNHTKMGQNLIFEKKVPCAERSLAVVVFTKTFQVLANLA
jgi:hypothetical protein